jgi:hypothetical protein
MPVRSARSSWWLRLAAAVAGALTIAAIAGVIVIRWRPAILIARAPTPGLAIVGVGLTTYGHVSEARGAAVARFGELQADARLAIEDALAGGAIRRRGAWRLVANASDQGWCPDLSVIQLHVRPFLAAGSMAERREARDAYVHGSTFSEAMRWLQRAQRPDGTWPAAGTATAPGHVPDQAAATALATLVFLGAGYDHRMPSRCKKSVKRAIDALVAAQRPDGSWCEDPANDALVVTAVAEAYAMSNDPALKEIVRRAAHRLDALVAPGAPPDDAWLAIQQVMALKSCAAAGVHAGDALARYREGFRSRWTSPEAVGGAWRGTGAAIDDCDAAAALVTGLVFTGRPTGSAAAVAAASLAASRADSAAWSPALLDLATTGVFQVGGAQWDAWNPVIREQLVDAMRLGDPVTDGSWDPPGGDERDRVVTTAWRMLALEVYYRYVPTPPATGGSP